jgi:Uma2 family endonuclease
MASPAITQLIEEPQRPITFEEYRALPDSDQRIELIRGELVMSAAPKAAHQRVAFRLAIAMQEHVESRDLGEVFIAPFDVRFSNFSGVQPDICFVASGHEERIGEDFLEGAPDLIVEVLSPLNRRNDLVRKRMLYADYAVPEYWIVDPEAKTITINVLDGDHYSERDVASGETPSAVLPGFAIDLMRLFRVPL